MESLINFLSANFALVLLSVFIVTIYVTGIDQIIICGTEVELEYRKNFPDKSNLEIKVSLYLLYLFKMVLLVINRLAFPLRQLYWKRKGVYYFQLDKTGSKVYEDSKNEYFARVGDLIKIAKSVRMSLGEAGSGFLEDPRLVQGMKAAVEKEVDFEILHGPRVDPETHTIYELARDEKLKVLKMDNYKTHHFTLIEARDGRLFVLDESVHDETLWNSDTKKPYWSDLTRSVYIYELKGKTADLFEHVYKSRAEGAVLINRNPELGLSQKVTPQSIFTNSFYINLIKQHFTQPKFIKTQEPNPDLF